MLRASGFVVVFLAASTLWGSETEVPGVTATYGWEDGRATVLGTYKKLVVANDSENVHSGARALKLVDDEEAGTPQAFLAWITGLRTGDRVQASFWVYDTTPGKPGPPSARIWAHYNNDPKRVESNDRTAGGNSQYPPGEGWSRMQRIWKIASGNKGLVVEARVYSNPGDTVWIDDLEIIAPEHARIFLPPHRAVDKKKK